MGTIIQYRGRLSGEPAAKQLLTVGTRVYNHGDMANPSHFGIITEVRTSKWGTDYEFTPDPDSGDAHEGKAYWIPAVMFSDEFKGTGLTRFVTEEAYNRWREDRIATMQREYEAMMARRGQH